MRNVSLLRRGMMSCEVEFIHTDGRQMFLTDWIPGLKPRIELDFRREKVGETNGLKNTLFTQSGVYSYPDNINFNVNNGDSIVGGNTFFFWNDKKYKYGAVISAEVIPIFNGKRNKIAMDWNYAYWTDNGTWKDRRLVLRQGKCSYPIYLFGEEGAPYNRSDLYIYGVKCWNDGVLERDFRPAKIGGRYGLLDVVKGKYWTSDTGVDFLGVE